MIDEYVLRFIESFLKKCTHCNRFDYFDYNKECCVCKVFLCHECVSNKLLINGTDGSSDELLTNMFKKEKIMSESGGEFCLAGGAYQTIKLSDYKV